MRFAAGIMLATAVIAASGCGSDSDKAKDAVTSFLSDVAERDYRAACGRLTESAFVDLATKSPGGCHETLARAFDAADRDELAKLADTTDVRVSVDGVTGVAEIAPHGRTVMLQSQTIEMRRMDDGWRIASVVVGTG